MRSQYIADRVYPTTPGANARRLLSQDVADARPAGAARQELLAGGDPRADRSSDVGFLVRRRADLRRLHHPRPCDAAKPPGPFLHPALPAPLAFRENSRTRE